MSDSDGYSYRGYIWAYRAMYGAVFAYLYERGYQAFVYTAYTEDRRPDVEKVVRSLWKEARDKRHTWRDGARRGQDICTYDGIPWEIHEIEDEDAYQIALANYLSNL